VQAQLHIVSTGAHLLPLQLAAALQDAQVTFSHHFCHLHATDVISSNTALQGTQLSTAAGDEYQQRRVQRVQAELHIVSAGAHLVPLKPMAVVFEDA
jgi:hypothetical protein